MRWQVIVPPAVETAITGRLGACERRARGHLWRVDVYAERAILTLDGFEIPHEAAPAHAIKFREAAAKWWRAAVAL